MTDGPEHRVIGVYRRHGRGWAATRMRGDRPAEGDWLDRFCAVVAPGGEVMDVGCGSGLPIARTLRECGFRVTGVDAAPEMLDMFRRNLPGLPAVLADMRRLALGRAYDGVVAWDSFFHLSPDDQRGMFARFRDHARPGAPLLFTSGPAEGSSVGELGGEPLYHGSLGPEEYRRRLEAHGFDVAGHAAEDPSCGGRTVWLARRRG